MPLPCTAVFHDAAVESRTLTLAQVADLGCLPGAYRAKLDGLALAVVPRGRSRLVLSAATLAARMRATAPAAMRWFPEPSTERVVVTLTSARRASGDEGTRCLQVVNPIASGSAPVEADFKAAACGTEMQDRPFRYDVSVGAVRAVRDVESGEITRGLPAALVSTIRPGDALYVSAQSGPVQVEREVHAVQPATPHHPMFVRSEDGAVFPVPPVETSR